MANVAGIPTQVMVKQEVAPATGSSTTLVSPYDWLVFTNGSTTAAQTVVLPTASYDGQSVAISNASIITAFTLSPSANGWANGTLAAGQGIVVAWSVPQNAWFVVAS